MDAAAPRWSTVDPSGSATVAARVPGTRIVTFLVNSSRARGFVAPAPDQPGAGGAEDHIQTSRGHSFDRNPPQRQGSEAVPASPGGTGANCSRHLIRKIRTDRSLHLRKFPAEPWGLDRTGHDEKGPARATASRALHDRVGDTGIEPVTSSV